LVLIDVVSIEVDRDAFPLHRPNRTKMFEKTRCIEALREIEIQAVKLPLMKSTELQGCLAECLGGKSSRVCSRASVGLFLLNEGDFFSKVSSLGGPFFPGRPGTDDDDIIFHTMNGLSSLADLSKKIPQRAKEAGIFSKDIAKLRGNV